MGAGTSGTQCAARGAAPSDAQKKPPAARGCKNKTGGGAPSCPTKEPQVALAAAAAVSTPSEPGAGDGELVKPQKEAIAAAADSVTESTEGADDDHQDEQQVAFDAKTT